MTAVARLPTAPNAAAAFDAYTALVRAGEADPRLKLSLAHNIAQARAWETWRDLYLAWKPQC